jgi:hypothetical protein
MYARMLVMPFLYDKLWLLEDLPIEDFDGETFGKRAGNLPWFRRGFGTAVIRTLSRRNPQEIPKDFPNVSSLKMVWNS